MTAGTALRRRSTLAAAGLGAWAVAYVVDPVTSGIVPRCPTNVLTGLACPGCGASRCLHAVAHLDFGAAAGFNLLVLALVLAGPLMLVPKVRSFAADHRPVLVRVLSVVAIVFAVARNVPAFEALAP